MNPAESSPSNGPPSSSLLAVGRGAAAAPIAPSLSTGSEFDSLAGLLGHCPDRLKAGEELRTCLRVSSLALARQVLCRADDAQRARRAVAFSVDTGERRRSLTQGLHDRCEAFVFAGLPPAAADGEPLRTRMPFRVHALSAARKVVRSGEEFDLSGPRSAEEQVETFCVANFGTLVLEPGARLVVRGRVLSLLCQRLVRLGRGDGWDGDGGLASYGGYDLGVLPGPGGPGAEGADGMDGAHGDSGRAGADGDRGPDAVPESTMFGRVARRPAAPDALTGQDGQPGGAGRRGRRGHHGTAARCAEITIREIVGGPVVVLAQPGDGGAGGAGGDGGTGGRGGNGGAASPVFVTVPFRQRESVRARALPGEPGPGGAPGAPGRGGSGGRGGTGGRDGDGPTAAARSSADGGPGAAGRPGEPGRAGHRSPAPRIVIEAAPPPWSPPQPTR
ncbi:hypothetical protein ACWEQ8_13455 [Streptomyces noursei]